ncbi:MAG TPA: type IV pilus assembly protein PilM [Solirubrobacterales bacterium]|nr:type IV pilus assembly protein PilM [Solirubrobacterales bacterium]
MQLTKQKKPSAVVGLDIEAGSIAAAEVVANGSVQVRAAVIEPLAAGAFREGEVGDAAALAEALKAAFAKHGLSKQVRLGVGNQRVVVRTVRLPAIENPKEMDAAVRFQVQEQMPMALEEAVIEHQVVGGVPAQEGRPPQVDVVVVAARRDMVASLLEPIRRAGLRPLGLDLSAFGMLRALAGETAEMAGESAELPGGEAVLYCNVGDVANLAVARGRACLFTRVSNAGLEAIAARLASGQDLTLEHASGWLTHVGLERPIEDIEGDPELVGQARRALEEGVTTLVDELRLSLDYYGAQEGAVPVTRVVLCGPGSAIPGLPQRMESSFGLSIASVRPSALAGYDELSAARLTLPYGLALEQ